MKRRFFTAYSAIAFLVFAAIVLLWVRWMMLDSAYIAYIHLSSSRIRVDLDASAITVVRFPSAPGDRSLPTVVLYDVGIFSLDRSWDTKEADADYRYLWDRASNPHGALGFGFDKENRLAVKPLMIPPGPNFTFVCVFPVWFVVLLTALPLILPIRRILRIKWRDRHAFCAHCGYNLTGDISGVCPECGTPVPPTARPQIPLDTSNSKVDNASKVHS